MLFFKSKTLSHREMAVIGFTLAVLSLLSIAVLVYLFPLFGSWLNGQGVYSMDFFLMVFFFVLLCTAQGLLLFGFPLYYAQDKKSHMTGFQILLYTLMWMIILVLVVGTLMVPFTKQSSYTLDDIAPEELIE